MPGIIDEFLLGVKMEGDPSGLVEAYKKIFDLQEEYNRRERERDEQGKQDSKNESKRGQWLLKIKKGVTEAASKGVGVMKQGVSIARGWAVALLAVDGAAMAVVGRLSQMAVEYQNVASATGTSSEKMKAWEDTFKSAGGSADDVRASMSQLYATARKQMLEGGEDAFTQALATFDVKMTDDAGQMRDTADIFSDIIFSARKMIEGGTDRSVVLQRMAGAGLSENLIAPLLAQRPEGGYRVTGEAYQKYYGRTQGLDELADASREISESATELSSVVRSKLTTVLTRMVESGVLTDLLDRITAFIEGIDADKVAEVMDRLINSVEKVIDFIGLFIPGSKKQEEYQANLQEKIDSQQRRDALLFAIGENTSFMEYQKFAGIFGEAKKLSSPGGINVTEEEALKKATELGLNVNQIFEKANLPPVNNEITVYVDNVEKPSRIEQRTGPGGASYLAGELE